VRPPSFDEEYMTEWSEWVLDHGLPEFPEAVEVGESVPVARWDGRHVGAVLHVQWNWSDEHDDDELISEVQVFDRTPDDWRVYGGQGGSNWPWVPSLRPPQIASTRAGIIGTFTTAEHGRTCTAVNGVAGSAASTIELVDEGGTLSRPIESTLGVFIVAFGGEADAVVRLRTAGGEVLVEQTVAPLGR
jgi:hypothetical protein